MSKTGKQRIRVPKLLTAMLILQMAGCVIVPYPVSDEIVQADEHELLPSNGIEITDQVYVTVGPRELIDDVSKRIVKHNTDIKLVDPLLFRDTAFPNGGWSLKELLEPSNRMHVSEKLDVQYLVLLTPLLHEEGEEEGIFIPLAFGALSVSENSTLSAIIIDLRSGSVVTRLSSSSSGHGRLLYYVIYIVAADPMTESAVISGLSESIAQTLAAESHSGGLHVAVLALENLEEALQYREETTKREENLRSLRETAEQGDQEAQWTLFKMEPTEGNLIWLCRAADQGHVNARNELGELYFYGSDKYLELDNVYIPEDLARSCMWFNLAGYADITWQTETDVDKQTPVPYGSPEVERTSRAMTAAELAEAKQLIEAWKPGQCDRDFSRLMIIDYAKDPALARICIAADHGDYSARDDLGRIYFLGSRGVKVDLPRSYMWYSLAADVRVTHGQKGGYTQTICDTITPEQRASSLQLLEAWKPGECEKDLFQ